MIHTVLADQVCPYCNSCGYITVQRLDSAKAVRCNGCRLVRTLPRPVFEYRDNDSYAAECANEADEEVGRRHSRAFVDFLLRHAYGPRLLEIGSGMGYVLEEAQARGLQAMGLEINVRELDLSHARGLDVRDMLLDDTALCEASVDVVAMKHVLEHLDDLRGTLGHVRRLLKPGGTLILSQPAYASVLARILGPAWYGWRKEQHIWHFDRAALEGVLWREGFAPVAYESISLEHPWIRPVWSWRPTMIAGYIATAAVARVSAAVGYGDQFLLAARRV